jgi:wyosine [tRNA(Phe)-imidazoG37] synthetase (radical SAM superfamily)
MSTIIYPSPIFGPVHSRRLGISLGINLLPGDGKVCSFDCVYCECGLNAWHRPHTPFPTVEHVVERLEEKLLELSRQGIVPDVFTFAGNGEPTIHPDFQGVIDDTVETRNLYFPNAKISVLSNATRICNEKTVNALKKVDNCILKLDSAIDETAKAIDRPVGEYSVENTVNLLKQFNGKFVLQTMFLKGVVDGKTINNTTDNEVNAWLKIVEELRPETVMIYTIDRDTPEKNLEKATHEDLEKIRQKVEKLGIKITVSE